MSQTVENKSGQLSNELAEILLDLSCYNPSNKSAKIDYHKVKASGIRYVILKAINASLNVDRRFEEHIAGCAEAGIGVYATYHYSYAKDEEAAAKAADAWIKAVAGRCNVYALDWEDNSLPKDARAINIIKVYADKVAAIGGTFLLYVGLSWYNSYLKKYHNQLPYRLWVARYYAGYKTFNIGDEINEEYIPPVLGDLAGWQYTSSGNVPGIASPVDMNIWFQDIDKHPDTTQTIRVDVNPYTMPSQTVKLGTTGNDANWVLWYLWRFGLLLDEQGKPDSTRINGMIEERDIAPIVRSQEILGTTPDGKVGKITRGLYAKVC